jgi:Ni,Fe-hydrogenase maturation factor
MGKTDPSHYCQYKIDLADKKIKIKTVVLGIGNILLGDEGVGIHVINRLQRMDFSSSILFIDGATAGFKLLTLFEKYKHANFIIIDALMLADESSGSSKQLSGKDKTETSRLLHIDNSNIYVIPLKDFYDVSSSEFLKDGFISFHQTSISDVLDLFYISHKIKISGYFIGINISKTLYKDSEMELPLSMGLSENIKALVPQVIDIVKKTLKKL